MLTQANLGKVFLFSPHDDVLVGNSNVCIDWCSAHFGFPGATRFHTGMMTLGAPAAGSIDVSIGIATSLKTRVEEILSRGVQLEQLHQGHHDFSRLPESPRISLYRVVSWARKKWIGWI
ncbi:hypothetical protein EDC04DRAFT_1454889 [Pisolithus marmoratus]|nr:hypothetical protein EDC04DRAFT_1454889 [Pisolithus marmoratus]